MCVLAQSGIQHFQILLFTWSLVSNNTSSPTWADHIGSISWSLFELSKVSNGTLRIIAFQGGIDCAWLAAISQWLLNLRVEICDSYGVCLYSKAPVTIAFMGKSTSLEVLQLYFTKLQQRRSVSHIYYPSWIAELWPARRSCPGRLFSSASFLSRTNRMQEYTS